MGKKTNVGKRFQVSRPWCLRTGSRVVFESDVFFKLERNVAMLTLGDRVFVGRGMQCDVIGRVEIGNDCLIAPGVFITDHNHGTSPESKMNEQACSCADVIIGNDVWIGTGAVILPGVRIGDGAVVGANAVVNREVREGTIVAGIPARQIGKR